MAQPIAYTEFWNNSYQKNYSSFKISCRHVWQSFIQESVRTIAIATNMDLNLRDDLAIEEIPNQAFFILGEHGIIRAADGHVCSECNMLKLELLLQLKNL